MNPLMFGRRLPRSSSQGSYGASKCLTRRAIRPGPSASEQVMQSVLRLQDRAEAAMRLMQFEVVDVGL
jgi:hypothetical protein